ncbi:unnamed protein product (macronuclear) [Paramecium tetraurelia]|uniref:TLDc domain-containing protein n=1 Tax=Paramecium tetraurelia TaxID=5888 RepID=A0E6U6_PARTE|nr:uncharacterized protein GSPATT00023741001 [Paramecium tetraurelia]CAK91013.1 unnamed protein product [Paramecium tetraurelia]|eukprot:XP_001458410.1 hypothetical protein (macronuclear) [Paramecium tetraurelia strain d4-2]
MEICAMHQGDIKYIILDKNSVKLACTECKDDGITEGCEPDQCILISKVLKLPEVLLSKINIDSELKSFFSNILKESKEELSNFKNYWLKQLQEIKTALENLICETDNYIDTLTKMLSGYRIELKRIIKFEIFEQYIKANVNNYNIDKMGSAIIYKNRNEINSQLELKIQDYINQITQVNKDEIQKKMEDLVLDYKNKVINTKVPSSIEILNSFKSGLEEFQVAVTEKSRLVNPLLSVVSSLLSPSNFQDILYKIPQKQSAKCTLIYQGSKDGFETIKFWNKIQNKSNLLMIMKLKNNVCIFGGYSPCQWLKSSQPQFIADNQGHSFLFIQNKSVQMQYYPIKSDFKHQAISVNQNYGPLFGKNDLQIFSDFKEGYINIGQHYFRDPKDNQQSLLLGPKLTEITECEVYEL